MPNYDVISSDTPALPEGVPATIASGAVWAALMANHGATAAVLAEHASVGKSTANKVLAALETAGAAVRQAGGRDGGRNLPDRWRPASDQSAAVAEPASAPLTADMPAAGPEEADHQLPPAPLNGRLARGQLRELVVAHLRLHPAQDFSPTALGRALNRSAGAIANVFERLLGDGLVSQTSAAPRRYRITRRGRR